ncbi:tripartite tricarboxylate transporter TctB family protein [Geminicoccaceae bacterium 1502E]|nr:tripartite tricarboxylate transporter TctB family protein [Geminicoccaceae bacterium 1502E]
MSDRIAGLLLAAIALVYGIVAGGYEQGFGDPLGPAAFPRIVAVPLGLFALVLVVRPDAEPAWPRARVLLRQLNALLVLVLYALLLEDLGFPLATFLAVTLLARELGARWRASLLTGIGLGAGLWTLFDPLLGLPLPLGLLAW